MRLIFLTLILVFCMNAGVLSVEDDREMTWEFAWNLMGERAYFEAAGEYQRFQFCYSNDSRAEISEFMVAYCHVRGRQFQRADALWQRFLTRYPNSPLAELAFLLSAVCSARGDWRGVDWNALLANLNDKGPARQVATYLHGWHLLEQGSWEAGKDYMRAATGMGALPDFSIAARRVLDAPALDPPPVIKSYRHEMHLSKWLPGLGQWSLGNHGDGVKSLIVNTGSAVVAYRWWSAGFRLGAAFMVYQGTLRFYKGGQYNAGSQTIDRNQKEIDWVLAQIAPENEPWRIFEASVRTLFVRGTDGIELR
ncbi:MAG: hypothetical protein Q7T82_01930 [Armatimonadota bacterium]|nr:hypothetical protein [Armatimonadota bacterium]